MFGLGKRVRRLEEAEKERAETARKESKRSLANRAFARMLNDVEGLSIIERQLLQEKFEQGVVFKTLCGPFGFFYFD